MSYCPLAMCFMAVQKFDFGNNSSHVNTYEMFLLKSDYAGVNRHKHKQLFANYG